MSPVVVVLMAAVAAAVAAVGGGDSSLKALQRLELTQGKGLGV